MQRILAFLRPLFNYNLSHPFFILLVSFLLAGTGGYFASQLRIDTDISNLVPESYESVKALRSLEEQVGGETSLEVAIQSPSFQANKKMAETVIDSAMKLWDEKGNRPYFSHAEFKKETKVLKNNALYLATEEELEEIKTFLEDEIEDAKLEANPFFVELDEGDEDSTEVSKFEEAYDAIIPAEYPMSADSTIMVVKLFPTGSKSNLSYLRNMFDEMDRLIQRLDVASFHPEMKVDYGGRLTRHLSEFTSIMNDVFNSFSTGIGSVILLVMLYFFGKKAWMHRKKGGLKKGILPQLLRMPFPVLVIGLPLLISLFITFGITYWMYGALNTMTSVLFVVLFGLGIDYGIHFYARYIELRKESDDNLGVLGETYEQMGPAIFTSAVTTASALYVLMFADFRGFSEFGFIAGTGILLALFAMLYVMPAFIVIFNRNNWIRVDQAPVDKTIRSKNKNWRYPMAKLVVVVGLMAAVAVLFFTDQIKFQYKFSDLEPEFPEYDAFREITNKTSSNTKNNPAYILADTNDEIEKILEKIRTKMETDTLSPTIESVEAIQERFPVDSAAARTKLEKIAEIRTLLQDPFLKDQEDLKLDKLRRAAQTKSPLSINQIPDYLTRRFMTKQGEIGKFVVVYPSVSLGDGRNSIAFKRDIGEITLDNGKTFHAASTSLVAAEMLMLMQKESPYMVGATFILVFIFMLFSFRSLKWACIAMIPLVVGLFWTFGVMLLIGLMLNFYNLVVLPAILGIGEDNGVHMTHRYHVEGRGGLRKVLASTGQHITIGSLTTMLGFWGLIFTNHPGLQTIGMLAIIGIGMTLLSGLTLHPALIQWLEDSGWISLPSKEV